MIKNSYKFVVDDGDHAHFGLDKEEHEVIEIIISKDMAYELLLEVLQKGYYSGGSFKFTLYGSMLPKK
jgi:hypothetical protein